MELTDCIKHHMARAFFASAWADQCEETGNARMMSGKEILDIMPAEIDAAAIHAADALAFQMEAAAGMGLDSIFLALGQSKPITADQFGHYCAMQSMGHGVGLFDFDIQTVTVPYVEFGSHSLQKDYF